MNQISGLMNRRDFLKLTSASTTALFLPGCAGASQQSASKLPGHPNVLFLNASKFVEIIEFYVSLVLSHLNGMMEWWNNGIMFKNA